MKFRYDESLPDNIKKGFKLSERVKGISKAHGIDGRVALERFVSESVLWAVTQVSGRPFMVKGGLLHDQRVRQTGDGDIMYPERMSAVDLYGVVGEAAALLRQHGIMWHPGEVRQLSMGGRGEGFRVAVNAKVGATRVCTHLDVSFGELPVGTTSCEFRSMFKGPSFTAYAQPLEAQAADKLAAVITLGMQNTRLKDYVDLLRLRGMGLDDTAIARHLHATMRERNADTAMLLGIPDGLSFEYADAQTWVWRDIAARDGGLPLDFLDTVCTLRHWLADIQDRLHELAQRDLLEPRTHLAAPSLVPTDGNVYSLSAWRRARA